MSLSQLSFRAETTAKVTFCPHLSLLAMKQDVSTRFSGRSAAYPGPLPWNKPNFTAQYEDGVAF